MVTNPSGCQYTTGITTTFLDCWRANLARIRCARNRWSQPPSRICDYIASSLFLSFYQYFPETRWTAMVRSTRPTRWFWMLQLKCLGSNCIDEWHSPLNSVNLKNPVSLLWIWYWERPGLAQLWYRRASFCPKCEHILKYELNTYANLGVYIRRTGTGVLSLTTAWLLSKCLSYTALAFTIDGQDYRKSISAVSYNIYNASSSSVELKFLVSSRHHQGRLGQEPSCLWPSETFKIGDKECTLVLIKNPLGRDLALDMIDRHLWL